MSRFVVGIKPERCDRTLFVHPKTVRTYDYGELIWTARGIAWSNDGDPAHSYGFEAGVTVEDARRRFAAIGAGDCGLTLEVGPVVERRHDMNPRGDM